MLTYNHLYTVTVIITEREAIYNLGLYIYICVHVGVTFAYKEFSLFLNLKKIRILTNSSRQMQKTLKICYEFGWFE